MTVKVDELLAGDVHLAARRKGCRFWQILKPGPLLSLPIEGPHLVGLAVRVAVEERGRGAPLTGVGLEPAGDDLVSLVQIDGAVAVRSHG